MKRGPATDHSSTVESRASSRTAGEDTERAVSSSPTTPSFVVAVWPTHNQRSPQVPIPQDGIFRLRMQHLDNLCPDSSQVAHNSLRHGFVKRVTAGIPGNDQKTARGSANGGGERERQGRHLVSVCIPPIVVLLVLLSPTFPLPGAALPILPASGSPPPSRALPLPAPAPCVLGGGNNPMLDVATRSSSSSSSGAIS